MKISDLIKKLEEIKKEHGDMPVRVQTLSHMWPPEPELRLQREDRAAQYVLLNP